ncbi:hypothetical protein D9619_007937 [Psilocybe cf. subviscida]|uniref:Uncharacterized protein n=1 Tax=Psilocybe cf. subviscida TaxID=2480587 RepID=A0A8H5ESE3_9AGAR|nr:hypothetical protein D9619_007937 [Psilocybe cf. subviscida]
MRETAPVAIRLKALPSTFCRRMKVQDSPSHHTSYIHTPPRLTGKPKPVSTSYAPLGPIPTGRGASVGGVWGRTEGFYGARSAGGDGDLGRGQYPFRDGGQDAESNRNYKGTYVGPGHNPHMAKTRAGDAPRHPAPTAPHFTHAIFERLHIQTQFLFANMQDIQAEPIKANPRRFRAIIPHKGTRERATFGLDAAAFVKALGYGDTKVTVVQACEKGPVGGSHNAHPRIWILADATDDALAFLDWHQTFAIREDLVFYVVPFDFQAKSWIVNVLSGPKVVDNADEMDKTLKVIAGRLRNSDSFRAHANQAYERQGIGNGVLSRTELALSSLGLLYVQRRCHEDGSLAPVWLLFCEPIFPEGADHTEWLNHFNSIDYTVGNTHETLIKGQGKVHCDLCHSDIHPAYECSQAGTPNWRGPKAEFGKEYEQRRGYTKARPGSKFNSIQGQ